jgi:flagellar biosynthesis protein FlhG
MPHSPPLASEDVAAPPPPVLWALAGGKGGVGRTLLAANMGIQMARLGRKVALADLDFQGANLPSYLGLGRIPRSLEGLLESDDAALPALLLDTSVAGLKLLAGSQRSLDAADRELLLKRFLAKTASLPVDIVLVDCGSGRAPETLDLFRASRLGILVTIPEPASFESLYLFTESLIQRILDSRLPGEDREKLAIAAALEDPQGERSSFRAAVERLRAEEPELCGRILELLKPLRLRLILNQARGDSETEIADLLRSGFDKFFGLELKLVGCVEYDLSVQQAVQKRRPLSQQYPNSPATQGIERTVSALLSPFREGEAEQPLSRDLSSLDYYRLLEVLPGAPSKEIQQSYQLLKRAYDPESPFRHPGLPPGRVQQVASLVENAYRTLIFLESRAEYDRKLVAEGILRPEDVRAPEPELPAAPEATPAAEAAETVTSVPVSAADESKGEPPGPQAPSSSEGKIPGRGVPVTGASLREHREGRKLSLEAIVERTKIRPSILEALEADRFAELPEAVFLRGFLRQLALCLGLDPAVVSREYMARIHPPQKAIPKRSR